MSYQLAKPLQRQTSCLEIETREWPWGQLLSQEQWCKQEKAHILSVPKTQRAQYPLIKEYGLNFKGLHIMIVKLYSLIKGSWALWEARPEPTTSATPRIAVQMVLHGLDRAL